MKVKILIKNKKINSSHFNKIFCGIRNFLYINYSWVIFLKFEIAIHIIILKLFYFFPLTEMFFLFFFLSMNYELLAHNLAHSFSELMEFFAVINFYNIKQRKFSNNLSHFYHTFDHFWHSMSVTVYLYQFDWFVSRKRLFFIYIYMLYVEVHN